MKITFVGTSHGVPSAERACTCFMIESCGAVYFIDAGTSVAEALLQNGKRMEDLRAIFTTHIHGDHTVGLLQTVSLFNWFYRDCSVEIFDPEQAHIDATKNWVAISDGSPVDEERIRFLVPTAGVVYQDENIKVEYIPTKHLKKSYAILVTEGEKRVLFSGDLSGGLRKDDVPSLIREDVDAFICELAHFGMEQLAPYLAECRAKKVLFTHVYPLEKYDDIEKAKGKYPFEIFAPADGDHFEID